MQSVPIYVKNATTRGAFTKTQDPMPTIWNPVFHFARRDTGRTTCNWPKNSLNPDMMISLNRITVHKMKFAICAWANRINIDSISSLSAIGSRHLPKLDVTFIFLAKYPSKKSVIADMEYSIHIISYVCDPPWRYITNMNNIKTILENVRILGICLRYVMAFKAVVKNLYLGCAGYILCFASSFIKKLFSD